jgi:hypothetical protein
LERELPLYLQYAAYFFTNVMVDALVMKDPTNMANDSDNKTM